jgi:hypothetical protein
MTMSVESFCVQGAGHTASFLHIPVLVQSTRGYSVGVLRRSTKYSYGVLLGTVPYALWASAWIEFDLGGSYVGSL